MPFRPSSIRFCGSFGQVPHRRKQLANGVKLG
jgi:hypothetical protein